VGGREVDDCAIHDYDYSDEVEQQQQHNGTQVNARTSSSGRCPESLMGQIASSFWLSQPGTDPSRWDWFFSHVHDDVEFGTNGEHSTNIGKALMEATFRNLNAPNDFQRIISINSINNAFGVNRVHNKVNKTQMSRAMGFPNAKRFIMEMLFTPPGGPDGCKVIFVMEYPEASVSVDQTLAFDFGQPWALTCDRIRRLCANHMPNFGTWNNSCDVYWHDAPPLTRIWTPYGDGGSILINHNLACANIFLSQIASDADASWICPMMGAPIPNAFGCWQLAPSARSEELKRSVATRVPPHIAPHVMQ
jgi:hypothetical protein